MHMSSLWLCLAEDAVTATAAATTGTDLASLPLFTRSLMTALFGLAGVFLVLFLFYIAIRLLRNIGEKKADTKE
jgi:hypothetical protein